MLFLGLISGNVFACDPIGCMFGGSPLKQDALILGEVIDSNPEAYVVKILHVFPQTNISFAYDEIYVDSQNVVLSNGEEMRIGGFYLISLDKVKVRKYEAKWAIYEMTTGDYRTAKITNKKMLDARIVERFVNTGGSTDYFDIKNLNSFRDILRTNTFYIITFFIGIFALLILKKKR